MTSVFSCLRRRLVSIGLIGAPLAICGTARADDKPELQFSAQQVEGDAKMRELSLRGDVVVVYERFRLTSPELTLRRSPQGIDVQGPGEVVFCPCPNPPVAVGFEGGLVAPPADLILKKPRLLVGGVTVLALPWFWLRAPTRVGVLPPSVMWRGEDGLLLGDGVHIPWRDGDGFNELDLTAAGYLQGGFELVGRFRTAHSTSRVKWDHLKGDLVAIDGQGAYAQGTRGQVAWDVDAIRGERARGGTLNLDEASRGYDRATGELATRWWEGGKLAVSMRAVGARGAVGPSSRPTWGPRLLMAFGGALFGGGPVSGAWDLLSTASFLQDNELGATELAHLEGGVDLAARPGFLVTRLTLRETMIAGATGTTRAFDAVASARVEVAAPLARAYAADAAPLVHVVEPRAAVSVVAARTSGAYWSATGRSPALVSGQVAIASWGLRTSWGRLFGRSGGSIEADMGTVAQLHAEASNLEPVARYRAAWSSRYWGLGAEGGALLRDGAQVFVGKMRVGEQDDWHLILKGAGRRGVEPVLARALAAPTATEPSGGWFSDQGWSAGAELEGKITSSVSGRISGEEDLTSRTVLQVRGAVGYAHPCRCISVDAFAARRLGREGVDVGVSIDLAPR